MNELNYKEYYNQIIWYKQVNNSRIILNDFSSSSHKFFKNLLKINPFVASDFGLYNCLYIDQYGNDKHLTVNLNEDLFRQKYLSGVKKKISKTNYRKVNSNKKFHVNIKVIGNKYENNIKILCIAGKYILPLSYFTCLFIVFDI